MREFLQSVKADLFERPMLTLLIAVAVALVGAVGYAVLGGGSTTPPPSVGSAPIHVAGISVTPVTTNPNQPVAETTNGTAFQRAGKAHNPFRPLPGAVAATKTAAASKKTATATTPPKTSSKAESGKPTNTASPTPTTPAKPTPSKPRPSYDVELLFGEVPQGAAPLTANLTPYKSVKLLTPLPSAKQPLVIFRGVTAGGKATAFTLVGELIIHGNGTCLPSTTQCELILLRAGQAEQLEYMQAGGKLTTYELRVGGIEKAKASSASAKQARASESKAGRALLGAKGLKALGGMWYSPTAGVLVFPPRRASAARARAAAQRLHAKR